MTDDEKEARRLEAVRQGARKRLEEELRDKLGVVVDVTDPDDVAVRKGLMALSGLMRSKARHADPWPTAPTIERVRQAGVPPIEVEVARDQPKAHRIISHLEALAPRLPAEHVFAALRLRQANEFLHGGSRVVGYEEATGGGGYRPRLEMTERQQMAGAFFDAVYRVGGWCEKQAAVIDNFVLEAPAFGAHRVLTPEEFGLAYGTSKSPKLARVECFGMIGTTLSALARRVLVWDRDQAELKRARKREKGAA